MASVNTDLFVRALYSYESEDEGSLSFNEGDVIQVITQQVEPSCSLLHAMALTKPLKTGERLVGRRNQRRARLVPE
jgi:hypothetical protein